MSSVLFLGSGTISNACAREAVARGHDVTVETRGSNSRQPLPDGAQHLAFWSPVLEGDTAVIELRAAPALALDGITLGVPAVSHQLVEPAHLKSLTPKDVSDIGRSGGCEIDVKCVTPQSTALVNASKAVAKIIFTQENGNTYLCTGQLLNDLSSSFTQQSL
jgi:hypothetical protein